MLTIKLFRGWMMVGIILLAAGRLGMGAPSGPLYIDDANGNVGIVDLTDDQVTVLGNSGQTLTDLGFTANGNLYGTTFTSLYSINKTNGAATFVGDFGPVGGSDINGLIGNGSGQALYAASAATQQLYSVSVGPFAVTDLTGTTDGDSAGDLAYGPGNANVLYETLNNGNLDKITISGSAFTASVVGNMGRSDVFGLATGDDGVTYAVAGTEIYSVNLTTAALTPVLDYGGHGLGTANGTAFISEGRVALAVPEPGNVLLFGLGLGALFVYRRMRRIPTATVPA